MSIPERITLRLGSLRESLAEACKRTGNTASEEIRIRLARSLRVTKPEMQTGSAGHGDGCTCVSCRVSQS